MGSSALSETCGPVLWLGGAGMVFLGRSPGLDRHSGAVPCLVVGLDGPVAVCSGSLTSVARSVLVPARVPHHLDARGGRIVSWYLDPASPAAASCAAAMRGRRGDLQFEHGAEPELVALGRRITAGPDSSEVDRWLDRAGPAVADAGVADDIAALAATILDDPTGPWSAAAGARWTGRGETAFLRSFAAQTGTSFRRYRLWARTLSAIRVLAAGSNLTRAAADAGFATPSHLSSTVHNLFGLAPTRFLDAGLTIVDTVSADPAVSVRRPSSAPAHVRALSR